MKKIILGTLVLLTAGMNFGFAQTKDDSNSTCEIIGAAIGGTVGGLTGGPTGFVVGSMVGGMVGNQVCGNENNSNDSQKTQGSSTNNNEWE